jgi:hypothetical protein
VTSGGTQTSGLRSLTASPSAASSSTSLPKQPANPTPTRWICSATLPSTRPCVRVVNGPSTYVVSIRTSLRPTGPRRVRSSMTCSTSTRTSARRSSRFRPFSTLPLARLGGRRRWRVAPLWTAHRNRPQPPACRQWDRATESAAAFLPASRRQWREYRGTWRLSSRRGCYVNLLRPRLSAGLFPTWRAPSWEPTRGVRFSPPSGGSSKGRPWLRQPPFPDIPARRSP